ncbi:MAG TPA: hypothetical protein VF171_08365 [Trueperaceae bacterium]
MAAKAPERSRGAPEVREPAPAEKDALGSSFGANTLFLIVAVVGLLHLMVMFSVEAGRLVHATRAISRLEGEMVDIEAERAELEAVIAHRQDEGFREQLARNKGFIYPDERRYITTPARPQP